MPYVLVVEDDQATAHWLLRLLTSRGVCRITCAATVAQALRLLDPAPDWVILDIDLPDGSGLEVLRAIRKANLPTRVVVSSGTRDPGSIAASLTFDPDLVLPKPLDPALLPIGLD
jgi:CheY-like chemotaxis protein